MAASAPASDPRFGPDRRVTLGQPLKLDGGASLDGVEIAYETYGTLNADGSNAIMLCHATTGDQYVASRHPDYRQARLVGAHGRPRQADRYGPLSRHLRQCTGKLHGHHRPREPCARRRALWPALSGHHHPRHGARAYRTARSSGDRAAARRHRRIDGRDAGAEPRGALAGAGRPRDGDRRDRRDACAEHRLSGSGATGDHGRSGLAGRRLLQHRASAPDAGLAVARMAAHITYLSEESMHAKFGRRLQDRAAKTFGFDADFEVESYLRHQGATFTGRFDANAYLYITKAMSYFDLAEDHGGRLADMFAGSKARFCLVSFDSDWLYPTPESRKIAHALNAAGAPVSFVELSAPFGHDSFLLDVPELDRVIAGFVG
jgi:homoserine O-acetyltransferase